MNYGTDSFTAIEVLFQRHAPLLMRVGDELRPATPRPRPGRWVPAVTDEEIRRMKRLRSKGRTIGEIARHFGCTWRSAWKHSNPSPDR